MAITRSPGHVGFTGFDQPDVEILDDDGTWCEGELRAWDRDDAGDWTAGVQWRRGPGQGTYFWTFAAADVRLDESGSVGPST